MNYKVIAGVSALALLVTMTIASGYDRGFTISVTVDTTIFLPTLCEDADSTNAGTLDFIPGGVIDLNDPTAVAVDTCASGTTGDWSIEMAGNTALDLRFKLDNASPQGISVALWGNDAGVANASPFTDNTNYVTLTTTDILPSWATNLNDGNTLQIWQRVAADTTAIGGSSQTNAIIITSQQHV